MSGKNRTGAGKEISSSNMYVFTICAKVTPLYI